MILFGVAAFVFLIFLVLISLHVRLCSDDLYFLNDFIEKGWLGSVAEFKYNTRWSGYLLFNTIFIFNSDIQSIQINLFFYYLVTIILFLVSSFNLIRVLFRNFTNIKLSKSSNLLLSALLMLSIYLSISNVIEVWFWTIASTVYLYPVIFFIMGLSETVSVSRSVFSYLIIFSSFFFIGYALENFAFCTVFLLLVLLVIKNLKVNHITIFFNSKLLIALISVLIPLLLSYVSGGIGKRFDFEISISSYNYNIDAERIMYVLLQPKNVLFIFFLGVFFITGSIFSENGLLLPGINALRRWIILNVLLLIIITLITFIPLVIVFKNLGPERAWLPINLFLCFSLVFWAFYSGNRFGLKNKFSLPVKYLVSVTSILIISIYSFRQLNMARRYSSCYDERINTILKLRDNNNKETIFLKPLPDSGVIASQELGTNNERTNEGLKRLLKLNFEIKSDQD